MLGSMKEKNKKFSIIPFQKKIEKPWGYEIIYTDPKSPVTGKILHLKPGSRLSLQYHDSKVETLCLLKGKAIIALSKTTKKIVELPMELCKGYFVNKGQIHRIAAITDIDIVESSTPEKGNTYRLEDDANRKTETEAMRKMKNRGWKK